MEEVQVQVLDCLVQAEDCVALSPQVCLRCLVLIAPCFIVFSRALLQKQEIAEDRNGARAGGGALPEDGAAVGGHLSTCLPCASISPPKNLSISGINSSPGFPPARLNGHGCVGPCLLTGAVEGSHFVRAHYKCRPPR